MTPGSRPGTVVEEITKHRASERADIGIFQDRLCLRDIAPQDLQGTFKPGDRLRLANWLDELNLSEMPIREALRLLQKEGLVAMHLHRGAEVATLSYQRGHDVTEARMTLEKAAALAALPHHDAGSLAELARLLDEIQRPANRPVRFCTEASAPSGPHR